MKQQSICGVKKLLLALGVSVGLFTMSTAANAVTFNWGAIAEGDFSVWGQGTGNFDTGELGNITSDAEGNWSLVVPQIDDSGNGQGGTSGNLFMTIGGIGVKATGTNIAPLLDAGVPISPDAFLDANSGGAGGLGVCSNVSCTSGVSGAVVGDDNASGTAGGETLELVFTTSIMFDPTGFEFRTAQHGSLTGTLDINGFMADIVGGSLNIAGSDAGLFASLTGINHTFAFTGDQFYLTVAEVMTVPQIPPPIPLPASLPLFGTGLGILGFLGWRRRRKAQAV